MNILKNIAVTYLAFLCLALVGCATARRPDLTGKWLISDKTWGLEFREGQVSEWERDEIQTEGSFTLSRKNGNFALIVNTEKDGIVSFTVELLDQNSMRLTREGQRARARINF